MTCAQKGYHDIDEVTACDLKFYERQKDLRTLVHFGMYLEQYLPTLALSAATKLNNQTL
jgi:hypothetical protein